MVISPIVAAENMLLLTVTESFKKLKIEKCLEIFQTRY